MIDAVYIIIMVLMAVCLLVQEALHYIERRELIDRLMARNLAEFKADDDAGKQKSDRLYRHREVIKRWRNGGDG